MVRTPLGRWLVAFTLLGSACKSATPPTDTTPPAVNKNPVIASITVTPTFGVGPMSPLTIVAAASDPDNDALTYAWTITNGTLTVGTYSGATLHPAFTAPMTGAVAHVTVTDGRGGTASADSQKFVVGSLNGGGAWEAQSLASFPQTSLFYLRLLQDANGNLSGQTITSNEAVTGTIQPGGTIDGFGKVSNLRLILTAGLDITINGQMQPDGFTIVGTFSGPGVFSGKALNGLPVNLLLDVTVH
jgi:hypothetical protein